MTIRIQVPNAPRSRSRNVNRYVRDALAADALLTAHKAAMIAARASYAALNGGQIAEAGELLHITRVTP